MNSVLYSDLLNFSELLEIVKNQGVSFLNTINDRDTSAVNTIKIDKDLNEKGLGALEVLKEFNNRFDAAIVVIATGMHKFEIECDLVKVQEHQDVLKPNKVCLENTNNKIADGLYVAGLASGAKTMFAIANGEGAKVACDIFKVWTGKPAVAHDNLKN